MEARICVVKIDQEEVLVEVIPVNPKTPRRSKTIQAYKFGKHTPNEGDIFYGDYSDRMMSIERKLDENFFVAAVEANTVSVMTRVIIAEDQETANKKFLKSLQNVKTQKATLAGSNNEVKEIEFSLI